VDKSVEKLGITAVGVLWSGFEGVRWAESLLQSPCFPQVFHRSSGQRSFRISPINPPCLSHETRLRSK
jgi:hypothetical protein